MDELNKPVRFDAVALGVSSSLNGTPVLAAGNDDGYELARLIGADQAQVALMQGMRTGQKIAAECVLQFTSGSDFLAFNQCTFN